MTVSGAQRNTRRTPDDDAGADNAAAEQNQITLNDAHTSEDEVSSHSSEDEASDSQMIDDVTQTESESEASEAESSNKLYFGEWSGVERLYKLVIQYEESDEELDWSEIPPSLPSAKKFGINLELNKHDDREEEMDELVSAMEKFILSQPLPVPRDLKEDIIRYLRLDFYTYKDAIAKTPEWLWKIDEILEEDTDSESDSESDTESDTDSEDSS